MAPARMKKTAEPVKVAPVDNAPDPVPAPVAADPVEASPAPHKLEAAPEVSEQPQVITGDLDPVTQSVLDEIPDRPKKAAPADVAKPADVEPDEAPSKPRTGLLLALGGVALGGLALVLNSRRSSGAAAPVDVAPAPVAPAPVAAQRGGVVVG